MFSFGQSIHIKQLSQSITYYLSLQIVSQLPCHYYCCWELKRYLSISYKSQSQLTSHITSPLKSNDGIHAYNIVHVQESIMHLLHQTTITSLQTNWISNGICTEAYIIAWMSEALHVMLSLYFDNFGRVLLTISPHLHSFSFVSNSFTTELQS